MKVFAFVFALAVALQPAHLLSDEEYEHTVVSVEACQVELTEAGKSASFITSAFFKITTDSEGKVQSWAEIGVPRMVHGYVDLAAFKCCVERWVLLPSEEYVVSLAFGTTGEALEKWSIGLGQKGQMIKVDLPRIKRGCNEPGA